MKQSYESLGDWAGQTNEKRTKLLTTNQPLVDSRGQNKVGRKCLQMINTVPPAKKENFGQVRAQNTIGPPEKKRCPLNSPITRQL